MNTVSVISKALHRKLRTGAIHEYSFSNQQSTTQKAKNRVSFMNTVSVISKALHRKLKIGGNS